MNLIPEDEVEQTWREFWVPIVAPDGVLDVEQVKKELFDYRQFMVNASEVYDAVTGGRISKVNTVPEVVIAVFEDYVSDLISEASVHPLDI